MKIRAHLLLSAALALLAVSSIQAQTVTGIFVGRSTDHVQTDASTVIVDPTAPGPTYGGAYGFTASVAGTGLSAPTVTLAAGSTMPSTYPTSHNGGVLGFNSDEGEWQYGSPNFNNWATTTAAERNSLFALGDYSFSIPTLGSVTLSLNTPTTQIAAAPTFTLTGGGTWTGGIYEINSSQSLTITSNAFTAFNANADGNIFFEVYDKTGGTLVTIERLYSDNTAADNFISYTINPGTLIAGHEYVVDAGFAAVVDKDNTFGSFNVAFFDFSTTMTISAIPEPSTYAMFAGLGALGVVIWRRRQKSA